MQLWKASHPPLSPGTPRAGPEGLPWTSQLPASLQNWGEASQGRDGDPLLNRRRENHTHKSPFSACLLLSCCPNTDGPPQGPAPGHSFVLKTWCPQLGIPFGSPRSCQLSPGTGSGLIRGLWEPRETLCTQHPPVGNRKGPRCCPERTVPRV